MVPPNPFIACDLEEIPMRIREPRAEAFVRCCQIAACPGISPRRDQLMCPPFLPFRWSEHRLRFHDTVSDEYVLMLQDTHLLLLAFTRSYEGQGASNMATTVRKPS
jgi:hypothetical protein